MNGSRAPAPAVALLGYGRFGRSLSALLADAHLTHRAFDPHVDVPENIGASDPADLVHGAGLVVAAVPAEAFETALRQLRPHLTGSHLVMDVASVKRPSVEAMERVLGSTVPWVATHPLFGPVNIARGQRTLRAVVCPNELHAGAAARARDLYERIGCLVVEQDADAHDRLMARTHALAFFVAKGLLDFGAADDLPLAPPSFQALARTIETVQSDAGHLFLAIERDNPHAADARQGFLDALVRVHAQLDHLDEADAASVTIPEPPHSPPELGETRCLIDEIDSEIVRLLARRSQLARRALRIKSEHGTGIRDARRELELLDERRRWAADADLSEDAVADIFGAILRFSRTAQADAD